MSNLPARTDPTARYIAWRGELAKALDPRLYTIEYLDSLVSLGVVVPIFGERAIIIVEVKEYPTGARAVSGVIAAGDLREIELSLIPQAEAWGQSLGCTFGMIESRAAWGRIMAKHGYAPFQVCLIKEL